MKKKLILTILIAIFCLTFISATPKLASAKTLNENIDDQLNNLDFSELQDFFDKNGIQVDFYDKLTSLLKGNYEFGFENILDYLTSNFLSGISSALPIFLSILAIVIFCELIQKIKGGFIANETNEIVNFAGYLGVVVLLISQIISVYQNTQNVIENIAKLNEIMSPIILTLMVASGGNVSASIYKPIVAFFSGGIINLFINLLLPIVALTFVLYNISAISENIKLNKLAEFFSTIIKWVIGLSISIFGVFLSVQGVASAIHDGISMKAMKYALSNSVPIVGGFLRDGFDLVVAGSVLIKNSVGVSALVCFFYIVISPVIQIAVLSLLFKFFAGICEAFSNSNVSNLLTNCGKCLSYLTAIVLTVSLMFFINILLMIFSANAFI